MIKLFSYQIPFKSSLKTSSDKYSYRTGTIITFEQNEITAIGEISPLPGFSKESLDDCIEFISENKKDLDTSFQRPNEREKLFDKLLDKAAELPSLRFGLDFLHHDFNSKNNNQSLLTYLFRNTDKTAININGVIGSDSISKSISRAVELSELGFKTLKLKVGVNESKELELIRILRSKFPDLKIRIDANMAWSVDEAISFLNKVSPYGIEYCEEPLNEFDLNNYKALKKNTNVNLALDENLGNIFHLTEVKNEIPFSLSIIKPMLIGSFKDISVTIDQLNSHDIGTVFTTSLESVVGRTITAILTLGWGAKKHAHGLSTGSMFKYDLASVKEISRGFYNIPDSPGIGINLNYNRLKRIL